MALVRTPLKKFPLHWIVMGVSQDPALDEIEMLYRTRFRAFLRVATAITGSRESGSDAVQDAFLNAVRGRQQYRGEGRLEAWLWRVVVRSALKARRRSREPSSARPEEECISTNGRPDDFDDVRAAIARLPERQRLTLFLRYYADLDYLTIANVLHVRPGTVAAALNAAHRPVRHTLEEVAV